MPTCKKVKFLDETQAMFYVAKLKKTSMREVIPQRAYLCEHCLCWHLTSTPNNPILSKQDQQINMLKNEMLIKDQKIKNLREQLDGVRNAYLKLKYKS
jgi:hypothetical protein